MTTAARTSCSFETQRIWPASRSLSASPPCGSLASNRICAVEASTNSTPINASCTSGRLRSVQVSSNAPSSAATTAASWVCQPCNSRPAACAAMTPSPATCAIARSMNTMPRLSTCWPRGTCESSTSAPAIKAGQRMLRSVKASFMLLLLLDGEQATERVVEQAEQILRSRRAAHRKRQHDDRRAGASRSQSAAFGSL